ncbi:hypothetical protein QTG56_23950 (plasmid) [Rossellomorea sp. AcN35-11]|nr:hypothetical protein [Rossellomorea aquimaris]WJV31692.1 hypothetical protein QTG56_23950 [Rossellomorea sp. AcN35-11]
MSKIAIVTFKRTVVVDEADKLSNEQIEKEAVDIWNEGMDLDDIQMEEHHITDVEIPGEEKPEELLVNVDLYGEGDQLDFWKGHIYNLTTNEFKSFFNKYKHDGSDEIFTTWESFLTENNIMYKALKFDINLKK